MGAARAIAVFALITWMLDAAAAEQTSSRYQLNGKAALSRDTPAQSAGGLELKGRLDAPGPNSAPPALAGGRFVLNATATASSLVCYNDTIFRDDFDGDGF